MQHISIDTADLISVRLERRAEIGGRAGGREGGRGIMGKKEQKVGGEIERGGRERESFRRYEM